MAANGYDSAHAYDAARPYDGLVGDEPGTSTITGDGQYSRERNPFNIAARIKRKRKQEAEVLMLLAMLDDG